MFPIKNRPRVKGRWSFDQLSSSSMTALPTPFLRWISLSNLCQLWTFFPLFFHFPFSIVKENCNYPQKYLFSLTLLLSFSFLHWLHFLGIRAFSLLLFLGLTFEVEYPLGGGFFFLAWWFQWRILVFSCRKVWMTGNHGSVGVGDLGISLLNWSAFQFVTRRR